ncbi:hypothetical protein HanIR_Chr08g0386681 [Helianthus annuus]|nr:hypothetical protein HanIR_Chr08g0386681 [Helianthus annuus]
MTICYTCSNIDGIVNSSVTLFTYMLLKYCLVKMKNKYVCTWSLMIFFTIHVT